MFRKTTFAIACTAATVLGAVAAPAQAAIFTTPVSLDKLIGTGDKFQVGDKLYSDFYFQPNCSPVSCDQVPANTLSPIRASDITVGGPPQGSDTGLLLNGTFLARGGYTVDFVFGYFVEVLAANYFIESIGLSSNAPTDRGTVFIQEQVRDTSLNDIGYGEIDNLTSTTDIPSKTTITLDKPVKTALVQKDVNIAGFFNDTSTPQTVRFSIIEQPITQQKEVPEPGTVGGLLALGSIGIGAMLKKRRSESDELAFLAVPNDPNNN